ncbi:hypothetical protein BDW74DRAFT_178077 [Aspergillus multicolor]|uniref:uncharacterized protein n=1 Tax=Aspergillus multicolor TaxID=41759 RepID=UPI003CCDC9B4
MALPQGKQARPLAAHIRLQLHLVQETLRPIAMPGDVAQKIEQMMNMFAHVVISGRYDLAFERYGIMDLDSVRPAVSNPARILYWFDKFHEWMRAMGWVFGENPKEKEKDDGDDSESQTQSPGGSAAVVDSEGKRTPAHPVAAFPSQLSITASLTQDPNTDGLTNHWSRRYTFPEMGYYILFAHNLRRIYNDMVAGLEGLEALAQTKADEMSDEHLRAAWHEMLVHFSDAYWVTGFLWEMERWMKKVPPTKFGTPHPGDAFEYNERGEDERQSVAATESVEWALENAVGGNANADTNADGALEYPQTIEDSQPEPEPEPAGGSVLMDILATPPVPQATATQTPEIAEITEAAETADLPLPEVNIEPPPPLRTTTPLPWPVEIDPPLIEANIRETKHERYVLSLMRAHPDIHWGRVIVTFGAEFFHRKRWRRWVRQKVEFIPSFAPPGLLNTVVYNLLNYLADDLLKASGRQL